MDAENIVRQPLQQGTDDEMDEEERNGEDNDQEMGNRKIRIQKRRKLQFQQ